MRLAPPRFTILDWPTKERIHETALSILATKGFRVCSADMRNRLARAGARVDDSREVVTIPPQLAQEAVTVCPGEIVLHDLDGAPLRMAVGTVLGTVGTYVEAIQWLDYGAATLRPSTLGDLRQALRLADALHSVAQTGMIVCPMDLPVDRQLPEALLAILSTTRKCPSFGIQNVRQARLVLDALTVAAPTLDLAAAPVGTFASSPTSPLVLDADTAEVLIHTLGKGLVPILAPCPMAGATSQFSLIGTVLQQTVENLFLLAAKHAVAPQAAALWGGAAGAMDMRAGDVSYGGIERSLLMLANLDMASHYGLPCHSPAASVDSCLIDAQSGAEKTWTYLTRVLSTAATGMAVGAVTNGKAVSLEQMVIDVDLIGCAQRLAEGIDTKHLEVAAGELAEVDHGGNFMLCDATLQLLRAGQEYFSPDTFNRFGTNAPPMVQRAHEKARSLLSDWICPVSDEIRGELEDLLQ